MLKPRMQLVRLKLVQCFIISVFFGNFLSILIVIVIFIFSVTFADLLDIETKGQNRIGFGEYPKTNHFVTFDVSDFIMKHMMWYLVKVVRHEQQQEIRKNAEVKKAGIF